MNKTIAISAVAFFAATSATFAADVIRPVPSAPAVPVVDSSSIWDGFYAGLNAGYGWGEGEITGFGGSATGDIDGWLGGAQVGYNFSSGSMVFGVEADYQAANIVYTEVIPGGTLDLGIESFGTLRGRIGADLDAFMPYVTAGLAFGQLGYTATPAGGGATISDSEWTWGWAAGAGVETMLADNISLKGEYLYVHLNDASFDLGGVPFDANAGAHTARIGVNFHF